MNRSHRRSCCCCAVVAVILLAPLLITASDQKEFLAARIRRYKDGSFSWNEDRDQRIHKRRKQRPVSHSVNALLSGGMSSDAKRNQQSTTVSDSALAATTTSPLVDLDCDTAEATVPFVLSSEMNVHVNHHPLTNLVSKLPKLIVAILVRALPIIAGTLALIQLVSWRRPKTKDRVALELFTVPAVACNSSSTLLLQQSVPQSYVRACTRENKPAQYTEVAVSLLVQPKAAVVQECSIELDVAAPAKNETALVRSAVPKRYVYATIKNKAPANVSEIQHSIQHQPDDSVDEELETICSNNTIRKEWIDILGRIVLATVLIYIGV
jgi:hypothetical protein